MEIESTGIAQALLESRQPTGCFPLRAAGPPISGAISCEHLR